MTLVLSGGRRYRQLPNTPTELDMKLFPSSAVSGPISCGEPGLSPGIWDSWTPWQEDQLTYNTSSIS